jgi:hypothetical protein
LLSAEALRAPLPAATLHAVQRAHFNRWAVAILLVTRLVLGEFVHAHDGAHSDVNAAAVAQESADCHDDTAQTSEPQCCETGGCECPCLFATAIASGAALAVEATTESRTDGCACGALLNQPFALFRPPASLTSFD